jgi:hypothetical protein
MFLYTSTALSMNRQIIVDSSFLQHHQHTENLMDIEEIDILSKNSCIVLELVRDTIA